MKKSQNITVNKKLFFINNKKPFSEFVKHVEATRNNQSNIPPKEMQRYIESEIKKSLKPYIGQTMSKNAIENMKNIQKKAIQIIKQEIDKTNGWKLLPLILLFLNCSILPVRTMTVDCYIDSESCARIEMIKRNYEKYKILEEDKENHKIKIRLYKWKN